MSIMFANRGQQPGAGHLYEVKAGRSEMGPGSTPEKRKVTAVPGQGLLYFKHSPEDQLLHLYWKTIQGNNPEVDLIIFPGETEFIRMKECSDGRVFMLKFKNSEERRFFWLQEQPDEAKDKEIEKKVNELLTNPQPVPARIPAAAGRGADRNQQQPQQLGAAALNNALGANLDELGPFGNMDQNQLMRLISMMNGGGGNVNMADLLPQLGQMQGAAASQPPQPATPPPLSSLIRRGTGGVPGTQSTTGSSAAGNSEGGGGSSAPPVSAQMLSQIISAMGPSNAEELQKRAAAAVDLSTVLTRRNTSEVVNKYKDRLSPLLPGQQPMQSPEAELAQTVGNPQFHQAADFIGTALQLGQMGAALEQFQLNGEVVEAAKKGDLVRFAEKLTAQEGKAEADKKIEADADAEENVESALKREAAAKQAKEDEKVAAEKKPPPPPPPAGDNMDLD